MNEEDFDECTSALLRIGEIVDHILEDVEGSKLEDVKVIEEKLKLIHETVSR